jgi:hypothetical protein
MIAKQSINQSIDGVGIDKGGCFGGEQALLYVEKCGVIQVYQLDSPFPGLSCFKRASTPQQTSDNEKSDAVSSPRTKFELYYLMLYATVIVA